MKRPLCVKKTCENLVDYMVYLHFAPARYGFGMWWAPGICAGHEDWLKNILPELHSIINHDGQIHRVVPPIMAVTLVEWSEWEEKMKATAV